MSSYYAYKWFLRQHTCKKHVFLISGKRTCGKDTLANILDEIFTKKNFKVLKMSFAKILKECFCKDCGYNLEKMLTKLKNLNL